MSTGTKIRWVVIVLVLFCLTAGLAFLFLQQITPPKAVWILNGIKQNSGEVIAATLLLAALVFGAVDILYRLFIIPINKLAEEVALIGAVNAKHRVKPDGTTGMRHLKEAINALAEQLEALQQRGRQEMQQARAEAKRERNMLAAILAELPQGVLICNTDGRILLYNQRAKQFFSGQTLGTADNGPAVWPSVAFVGLGRSIYDFMDRSQITHALEDVRRQLQDDEVRAASNFVAVSRAKELLRVEVVPVLDVQKKFTGFILIFRDITANLASADRLEVTLKTLVRRIRASSAGIRAAIEAIRDYPQMGRERQDSFQEIVHKEAVSLGLIADRLMTDRTTSPQTEWPLVTVPAVDLLQMIKVKARQTLGLVIRVEPDPESLRVLADSYSLSLAVLSLLARVRKETGPVVMTSRVARSGSFVNFDLTWKGRPVKVEMLRKWSAEPVAVGAEGLPFTFREVFGHHQAEVGAFADPGIQTESAMRFFMPICGRESSVPAAKSIIFSGSRPVFYDFNLFENVAFGSQQARQRLADLSFTVFDTETTGLDPDGGDEILSIGAMRIVNGRLLKEEFFDQLIDPGRSIPPASTRIHGIAAEMVAGRPGIDEVLPRFRQFVADTVLVGHNAAFDMRMLQVKESSSGTKFENPVLDTLLLSAVIHPAQTNHTLEAIAERLGVSIVGRHSAMGDTVTTAELFLRLIPLLARKRIFSLQEALEASRKTYYARIKY